MDPYQIRQRCPSSRFMGTAILRDHRLAFTLRSKRRRCGVANVLPAAGQEVHGILYRINRRRDWDVLDAAEGYKSCAGAAIGIEKNFSRFTRQAIPSRFIMDLFGHHRERATAKLCLPGSNAGRRRVLGSTKGISKILGRVVEGLIRRLLFASTTPTG